MAIRTEPCDWPIDVGCCPEWDGAPEEDREFARRVAAELVWRLSGRRFGLCEVTLRPCRRSCADPNPAAGAAGAAPFTPFIRDGQWYNARCGCVTDCSCTELCELALPAPVHDIVEITLDGDVVPAESYRVDNHRMLVRTDGDCWPLCQDLGAAVGEPGAFAVTYRWGIPVPPGGQYAAGVYACELLKACTGEGHCRLPKRVQQITREGVTMAFIDPMRFLADGLTGVPETDQWIVAVNPNGLRGRSRVYSVDHPPARRTTWP